MNTLRIIPFVLAGLLLAVLLSCNGDDPVRPDAGFTATNARTSDCGGFSSSKTISSADTTLSETLSWRYDKSEGIIEFINSRVELNCCGKHSISASRVGDTLVISESDQPADNGRCKCLCMFDFAIDVKGAFVDTVTVRLERMVDTALDLKWTFAINLSETSGILTVPKEN